MSSDIPQSDVPESIAEKLQRLETIQDTLESGEVSLEDAHELYSEGQTLIDALEADLDLGDSDIIER